MSERSIVIIVDAGIGKENKGYGEEKVRESATRIAREVMEKNNLGALADAEGSLILNIYKTPFRDSKVSVKIFIKIIDDENINTEPIRKPFVELPWCFSSQIFDISEKDWITI